MIRDNIVLSNDFVKKYYRLSQKMINWIDNNYSYLWNNTANNLHFVQSPLKDYAYENMSYNNNYLEAVRLNGTRLWFFELIYRLIKTKNIIAMNKADTGVGKSYSWMSVGGIARRICYELLDYDYDVYPINNIVFEIDDYLELGKNKKQNMFFHNDEEDLEKFGIGSYTNNEKYKEWMKIMRSQQLHHLSCSPVSRMGWDVPKHFTVDVLGINEDYEYSSSIWFNPDENLKYPICMVILPHPKKVNTPSFMQEYEKRKKEHQEKFLTSKKGDNTRKKWLDIVIEVIQELHLLEKRDYILDNPDENISRDFLNKKEIRMGLLSMYPRGFGHEEKELLIDMVYNFCWDKLLRDVDKEYIMMGLGL